MSKWQGESLQDRSILIMPEQGFGDQIQFVRYAQWLKSLGATVLVGTQAPLTKLFQSCPWIDQVIGEGESFQADFWVFPMSLPMLAKTELGTIPAKVPYLFAQETKIQKWAAWLSNLGIDKKKPIVGICWQGASHHVQDSKRSIPAQALSNLVNLEGYQFIGLTKGENAQLSYEIGGKTLHNAGPKIANFADTAGLVENLNLLITVDSAPAHLAGAMNKPCWVLLDSFADFRWLQNRANSPWYPASKLYRKEFKEDWDTVIKKVSTDLSNVVAESSI
jgi:ADP-heptose:LPS heptosyltransferase